MPNDPHAISLAEAIDLTTRWRGNMPKGAIKGARYDRIAFDKLLAAPGCAGIRIYFGMKADTSWNLVLVATDASGNDLLPTGNARGAPADGDDDPPIEEQGNICPPLCDDGSPLNGGTPPA